MLGRVFKATPLDWAKQLQGPKAWLVALTVSLAALHLFMLSRANQPETFNTSILLWLAVASLLWEKRQTLSLRSGVFSSVLGACLIALVLLRAYSPAGYHLNVSPFLSGVGLCLLASGARQLLSYWKELIIVGLLLVSRAAMATLDVLDLSTQTAKFAGFLLYYIGQNVQRQGVFLILPTGTVEVYAACSGAGSILQMLNLAVVFFLLFPTTLVQKAICLVSAVLIGFVVNAFRVALMAILVAVGNMESFEYWHSGNGSLVFSMIAVVIFIGFCWIAFLRNPPKSNPGLSLSNATYQDPYQDPSQDAQASSHDTSHEANREVDHE
jgi:cyanoexosortase A